VQKLVNKSDRALAGGNSVLVQNISQDVKTARNSFSARGMTFRQKPLSFLAALIGSTSKPLFFQIVFRLSSQKTRKKFSAFNARTQKNR